MTKDLRGTQGRPAEMDDRELQHRLIYSAIVAGKSAKFTDKVMDRWAGHCQKRLPFDFINILIEEENLDWVVRDIRAGNYTKLTRCFREMAEAKPDLWTCSPEDLEKIHGIGFKTSRFFILWTRPDAEYAALDVHVLRWLRSLGHMAPKATPGNPREYRRLELIFLEECRKRGKKPRELDHEIWNAAAKYE